MKRELGYSWHESGLESKLTQIMKMLLEIQDQLDEIKEKPIDVGQVQRALSDLKYMGMAP